MDKYDHRQVSTGRVFSGSQEMVRSFLRSKLGRCYVYILRRPNHCPFYVGKGTGYRLFNHVNEARYPEQSHKLNVIRLIATTGHGIVYEIDSFHDTAAGALAREIELIAAFGRVHEGGCLTNNTAGGDGGSDPSPETRDKHRKTLGGIPENEGDRRTVNRYFQSLALVQPESICVKPESEFKARCTLKWPTRKIGATSRQAAALATSAIANRIRLKPGCQIPRRFTAGGVPALIENGASSAIIGADMGALVTAVDPRDEAFVLDERQLREVVTLLGINKLVQAGALVDTDRLRNQFK